MIGNRHMARPGGASSQGCWDRQKVTPARTELRAGVTLLPILAARQGQTELVL